MLFRSLRPLLFRLDPEAAHTVTLASLSMLERARLLRPPPPCTEAHTSVFGLDFPNPVGLAAGLDKNGAHIDALATLGFGFIEVGTVTPRAQPGNAKPRLFRIPESRALVNRMGFNNDGVERLVANVLRQRYRGILGINIGKNFDTPIGAAVNDYLYCLRRVYPLASYVTINISSPNTLNLRQLQQQAELDQLLCALKAEQAALHAKHGKRVPLVVKLAPDLSAEQISSAAQTLLKYELEGVIATNTTTARDRVEKASAAGENGGLSGEPLFARSTQVLRQLASHLGGKIPLIGVGGIMSGAAALEKFRAGARLVQIYTGLVYRGPELLPEILTALAQARVARAASC